MLFRSIGIALDSAAIANSLIARVFAPEQPALRNFDSDSSEIAAEFNLPPDNSETLPIIVAAAFVDNCCERIDPASDSKLLRFGFLIPIGQGPETLITSPNLGSILRIRAAIFLLSACVKFDI